MIRMGGSNAARFSLEPRPRGCRLVSATQSVAVAHPHRWCRRRHSRFARTNNFGSASAFPLDHPFRERQQRDTVAAIKPTSRKAVGLLLAKYRRSLSVRS